MYNRLRRPGGWGCCSLHILKRACPQAVFRILHAGLLFSAHFLIADVPVFIAIPLIFCFLSAVVIVCIFYGLPPLSSRIHHSRQRNAGLLSTAQFYVQRFSSVSKLRIRQQPRQIQLGRQNPLRPPQKKFPSSPLLSSAHFQNLKKSFPLFSAHYRTAKIFFSAIYAVNNNRGPLLLSAAQFQIACLPYAKSFAALSDCYSAHILPHSPHFIAQVGLLSPAYCCSKHRSVVILGTMLVIPRTFRLLSAAQLYLYI